MAGVKTLTTRTSTLTTDEGVDIILPDEPYDGEAFYRVQPDGTIRVAYLLHDDDAENPLTAYDCGEFVEFSPHRYNVGHDGYETVRDLIREHGKRVRLVHNLGDRRCGSPYVNREDLASAVGAYVVPEDATSPDEYAAAVFEEVAAWADGYVYGVVTFETTPGGGIIDEPDACFGYYGDYAETVAREFIETGNNY